MFKHLAYVIRFILGPANPNLSHQTSRNVQTPCICHPLHPWTCKSKPFTPNKSECSNTLHMSSASSLDLQIQTYHAKQVGMFKHLAYVIRFILGPANPNLSRQT